PLDALRTADADRIGISVAQKRPRHTPPLPSTGASRRRPHSDRLSGLLPADNPETSSLAARPGVDAHGGAGEIGRNQNDRCVDSYGRSTLVDSAALHTAFARHQATHRETEIAVAEPAATAPCRAKRELRNQRTDRPVSGPSVVKTFHQPRLIPKYLTESNVPSWESSAKLNTTSTPSLKHTDDDLIRLHRYPDQPSQPFLCATRLAAQPKVNPRRRWQKSYFRFAD